MGTIAIPNLQARKQVQREHVTCPASQRVTGGDRRQPRWPAQVCTLYPCTSQPLVIIIAANNYTY